MDESISRAAKDLVQKMIADVFQSSLTEWYGLSDMRIIGTRPSAVPLISVQEHLLDRVFVLADHSLLHLEFQSTRERTLYRFYRYAVALTLQYQTPVRTVVIYLVPAGDAPTRLELGSVDYTVQNISIAEKDGTATWARLRTLAPEDWAEGDIMDLAFFPFMKDARTQAERAILAAKLASTIPGGMGRLASALIVGLTSSLVEPDVLKSMKEVIRMNDLITELAQEALARGWKEGIERGRELGLEQGKELGLEQGKQLGLEVGKAEGRVQGRRELLVALLSARFGELPVEMTTQLENLTDTELLMVARELWSVESLETLTKILNSGDKS